MSTLHAGLVEYLELRRSFGYKLRYYDRILHAFISFVESQGGIITVALAVRWATHQTDVSRGWHARHLSLIRGFARYWSTRDPRTQVPPPRLLPNDFRRRRPFLYTDEDIRRLLESAAALRCRSPLWPETMATIIGLLAVTGMRIGEVVALDDNDIDWKDGVLTIRLAKFGKSRLIPLHHSTLDALSFYIRQRNRMTPRRSSSAPSPLFLSSTGRRADRVTVGHCFRMILLAVALPNTTGRRRPVLHDFRHRFAVNTLLRAYRAGQDAERWMFLLSTFLGHTRVENTYWYLSAAPELMGLARKRLERSLGRIL